jgi:hypothetical protein
MKTIADILKKYNVTSYKETKGGLVAIRKSGYWWYFRYNGKEYYQTGSTLKYKG